MEKKLLELIAKEKHNNYNKNTSRTRKHTAVLKLYYK